MSKKRKYIAIRSFKSDGVVYHIGDEWTPPTDGKAAERAESLITSGKWLKDAPVEVAPEKRVATGKKAGD